MKTAISLPAQTCSNAHFGPRAHATQRGLLACVLVCIKRLRLCAASVAALLNLALFHAAWAEPGMLRIATKPGDAQIFINGQRKGNSPSEEGQNFAIKLRSGEYTVEAIKPQGPTELFGKKTIFVADDSLQTITIEMAERPSASFRAQLKQKFGGRTPQIDMLALPAGSFERGDSARDIERPVHRVEVGAFEMGRTEVTFDQWDACVANGGCDHFPKDEGWGRGNRPVINVSWEDAQQFITWLNRATGQRYRLPSEAEWEYAARAGTTTRFNTGECLPTDQANYDGNNPGDGCPKGEYRKQTLPAGSLKANAFGLFDMHGNVWEWTQDCWNSSYSGAPSDGSAWARGDCGLRVRRGGSWSSLARSARSATRSLDSAGVRNDGVGFRLSRSR
jgi:formylglycine-generating enzyme required for sulfatase activity